MLVIDSNQAWWFDRKSNFMIWWYPDFSKLLVKPQETVSPTSWTYFQLYWIDIHWIASNLSENTYYKWTSTASTYWQFTVFGSSCQWNKTYASYDTITTTQIKRVLIPWMLQGWEIIWKEILYDWSITQSSNYSAMNWKAMMKAVVQLLHSDWTLTDVWEIYFLNQTSFSSITSKTYICKNYIQTNWVVAQAWDYVVVSLQDNIQVYNNSSSPTQANVYYQVNFWYDWTPSWTMNQKTSPIQISID